MIYYICTACTCVRMDSVPEYASARAGKQVVRPTFVFGFLRRPGLEKPRKNRLSLFSRPLVLSSTATALAVYARVCRLLRAATVYRVYRRRRTWANLGRTCAHAARHVDYCRGFDRRRRRRRCRNRDVSRSLWKRQIGKHVSRRPERPRVSETFHVPRVFLRAKKRDGNVCTAERVSWRSLTTERPESRDVARAPLSLDRVLPSRHPRVRHVTSPGRGVPKTAGLGGLDPAIGRWELNIVLIQTVFV